ncbi:GGGtGRT protein [Caproiciproducens faecalis]|uniref:GGGtGRT protein n=1 Tax=Caproiciproducens faecalis TaxID=2820301 RepID=A0ABS7DQB2_9FIRM|nr:GGGtGRT protein [Caproiciproducens faecalis]MBW7572761.1 GGGtGRT protein [Caproiciproducens faecalis]
MANDVVFEGKERRMAKIEKCLAEYGLASLEDARDLCLSKGIDVDKIVKGVQPIAFENASWAYTLGCAIGVKTGVKSAAEAAEKIGLGLEAFCIPGSVAEQRKVGLGHGNLGAMLLRDETKCFAFLAGHESFAAAEGAIGIARTANRARKEPLRIILNGLGKDAAYIISRVNGFTYVKTDFDFFSDELKVVETRAFSDGERAAVKCYGANDVREGVAIMQAEGVDVSITGNSTNPTRFQHLVAGTYKKWAQENGKKYFSVASGGGTGRTLHPDNMGAGPASYGLTDSMGRMHGDAQFAGSSSVPAHVEMMGLIGMGNNPMVGATVACAVAVFESCK